MPHYKARALSDADCARLTCGVEYDGGTVLDIVGDEDVHVVITRHEDQKRLCFHDKAECAWPAWCAGASCYRNR